MKLYHILILSLYTVNVYGQTYISFPEVEGRWVWEDYYYDQTSLDGSQNLSRYGYYYELKSDTTINEKQYKNIGLTFIYSYVCAESYDGYHCQYPPVVDNTDIYRGLVGAIREESKRIFYYQYTDAYLATFGIPDTTEILLYDFNLDYGDTIFGMADSAEFTRIITDTLTIVLADGLPHRVFTISGDEAWGGDQWYEGFGSVQQLFGPYEGICESCNLQLYCFSNSNIYVYGFDSCETILMNQVDDFQDSFDISVTPNPFITTFKISELPLGNETTLYLFNMEGNLVYQKSTRHSVEFVNPGQISSGAYLLRVYSNGILMQTLILVKP